MKLLVIILGELGLPKGCRWLGSLAREVTYLSKAIWFCKARNTRCIRMESQVCHKIDQKQ